MIESGEHVLRDGIALPRRYADGFFSNPEEMINEADAYLYVAKKAVEIRRPGAHHPDEFVHLTVKTGLLWGRPARAT